ncbi:MAG: alpha-amylase family glycosyl hydrolase [Myxococcales bacterium]
MKTRLFAVAAALFACSSESGWHPGQQLTLRVDSAFAPGTTLRDAYSGNTVQVDSSGSVKLQPEASGVVLLERDGAPSSSFTWPNATVYFAMTDRFFNGDSSNDHGYGRQKDGASEVGTWHGGDFKGLAQKLDYLASLGVSALWISPVVEQVHGWVGGGSGDFKYYGYHGYWALDFTRIDRNFGTVAELQELIDQAHQRGIRVLLDVVMNHPGYATGDDLVQYLPEAFKDGTGAQFQAFAPSGSNGWLGWNDLVDYTSLQWQKWWTPSWIRAGLGPTGMFTPGGADDLTRSLSFLPDFKTESTTAADYPTFFSRKTDTGFTAVQPGFTVRDHLVKWHSDWVRQLGVDGFRCDTAKNVELDSWKALKAASAKALQDWKAVNPSKKLDDAGFWMVGEVFPHGVVKDSYFSADAFDSLLNFALQPALIELLQTNASLEEGANALDGLYAPAAALISTDPSFDVLNYISSHDTKLFFPVLNDDPEKQRQAGTALMLAPGGAQIFYGDESGRRQGPAGSDGIQGTRSDMNWDTTDASILAHWQKLGQFRKKHAAVGGGAHQKLASPAGSYAFSRKLGDDAVVVVLTASK